MNYQERYLAHQVRKSEVLKNIGARHSERVFDNRILPDKDWDVLKLAADKAPSSCDRKAISVHPVKDRHNKNLLGGLLVGGVGWIHRASVIIMLYADMEAYKSPNERDFMCYLDAGHVSENIQLAATEIGMSSCFCNPNCIFTKIMTENFRPFEVIKPRFVGAIAVGYSE